jgi:hypothetical protein
LKFYFSLFFISFSLFSQSNFEKGEKLYAENRFQEARHVFENENKASEHYYSCIEYLGDIECNYKNWDKGIEYFDFLKNKFPNNANYQYKYGGALGMKAKSSNKFVALGLVDSIENAFLNATTLDKKHIESRWALVMFYIEIPAIIGGSEEKAQKYAKELMNISKVDGYLAKAYIDVYFKRYTNAEFNYKKAHEIGWSLVTFQKLYDLYLNKMKDPIKAKQLKIEFNK